MNETTKYAAVYFSYGACAVEAELDVLTGQAEILRTDILFDCGQRYVRTKATVVVSALHEF